MEQRGIRTVAGDLWREASGRLEEMRELVLGLREGLAEALRGADFSSLQQVSEPAKEREVERTYERDMGDDFGL